MEIAAWLSSSIGSASSQSSSGSCTTAMIRPAEVEMEMAEDTSPMSAEKDELREDASCKNIVIEP